MLFHSPVQFLDNCCCPSNKRETTTCNVLLKALVLNSVTVNIPAVLFPPSPKMHPGQFASAWPLFMVFLKKRKRNISFLF